MVVALKYCGACNPTVDLAQIGRLVADLAREHGWQFAVLDKDEGAEADVLVLLCGCQRTCIDREEVRRHSKQVVLVAGERLGWHAVKENKLPLAIIETIQKLLAQ